MTKLKKCKACGSEFMPMRPMQQACTATCAMQVVADRKRKKAKSDALKARRRLRENDRAWWLKKAQEACNAYIRERDKDLPCISCGRFHQGQWHAGHYRTVGANPELRFEELNIHRQCAPCNNHKSGDIVNYRINLIERIGQDAVDWLEGKHEAKKYTIDDLNAIREMFKEKLKLLQGDQDG